MNLDPKPLNWGRSQDGYCASKCGRFRISPLWCGRVNPLFWKLEDGAKLISAAISTQREAKQIAARIVHEETHGKPSPAFVLSDDLL